MAHEELLFRGIPRLVGDPPQLLEAILAQVEGQKQKEAIGLILDTVAGTLQLQLKLVQGLRGIAGGG
jgi:hypothetical protein